MPSAASRALQSLFCGKVEWLGDRLHFAHLRNVTKEAAGISTSFHEAEHLDRDTDMAALTRAILREERSRRRHGRNDWNIPIRPDRGMDILDDLKSSGHPGYPSIGRLKGLAELPGMIRALRTEEADQGDHNGLRNLPL